MEMSNAAPQTIGFLDLAPELRNHIYAEVYDNPPAEIAIPEIALYIPEQEDWKERDAKVFTAPY
jgi:hypothetical protein